MILRSEQVALLNLTRYFKFPKNESTTTTQLGQHRTYTRFSQFENLIKVSASLMMQQLVTNQPTITKRKKIISLCSITVLKASIVGYVLSSDGIQGTYDVFTMV